MPPEWLVAQHGVAIMQSSMQLVGHEQHLLLQHGEVGPLMHGFIIGRQHAIGQSAMLSWAG